MDFDSIKLNRNKIDQLVYYKVANVEKAKLSNANREKLLARRDMLQSLVDDQREYLNDVTVLATAVDTEDRGYKNRRLNFVDTLITESLAEIFPADGLVSKLTCDFYRKTEVTLELRDKHGNVLDPDICSGKLQQYLISFAAVAGIMKGLGTNRLYIDEAFGAGAPEILGEIGKLIKKHVDDGMQILLVAQNPGLYQDLPRHEIVLRKDPVTEAVYVKEENDY